MGIIQKILIVLVALVLLAVTVLTWGSFGSILTMFCFLLMVVALLQRVLMDKNEMDADDFRMEQ